MRILRTLYREYAGAYASFGRNARLYLLGASLLGVGANLISLLFSLYLKGMGHSEASIGGLLSMRALGSAIVALPASLVVARLDARRFLPASALLAAAAYLAQSLALSGSVIAGAVFLAGAFSTVFQVSAGPFFMRNCGEAGRVHLFSLNGALSMGTGLVGSLAGGFLKDGLMAAGLGELPAYRVAMLAGAAFVLASVLPFARIVEPAGATGGRGSPGGGGAARGRIETALWIKLILPGFLVGLGAGATIPYLNLYFKLVFGLGDSAIGAAVAAGQVATFLGMAAGPALARRIGKARSVFWTQGLSVPLILVLAAVHALPLAIFAYLARQALMNMSTPIQENFSLELVPPDRQGLMNAVKMLAWTGSWTIATRVSGEIIERRGFGLSFVVTASLYALSTLCYWLFFVAPSSRTRGR